ncbi:MAG: hypothetical protein DKINENOH_00824 [bacterium]|nr:hypothetical protein [bacterium]
MPFEWAEDKEIVSKVKLRFESERAIRYIAASNYLLKETTCPL